MLKIPVNQVCVGVGFHTSYQFCLEYLNQSKSVISKFHEQVPSGESSGKSTPFIMKIHHIQFHHIIIVHSVPSCFHYAPFSSIIFHSVPTCSIQFQHHHNSSSKSYSIFTFFQKRHHLSSKSIRQIINIHENPFHIQLFNYPLPIQFMFRSIFHSVNH